MAAASQDFEVVNTGTPSNGHLSMPPTANKWKATVAKQRSMQEKATNSAMRECPVSLALYLPA